MRPVAGVSRRRRLHSCCHRRLREPALRAYEQERRGKTATLLGQGRRTAAMMRTMNPVAIAARDTAIRLMPVAPIVRILMTINRRAGTRV